MNNIPHTRDKCVSKVILQGHGMCLPRTSFSLLLVFLSTDDRYHDCPTVRQRPGHEQVRADEQQKGCPFQLLL
jgi:hypothetical protein